MATSAVVTLAAGTMNIAELVFAHDELGVGATGFALLVSAYGFGLIGGSIYAGRDEGDVRRRYFAGLAALAARAAGHRRRADARGRDGVASPSPGSATGCSRSATARCSTRAIPERVHGRLFGLVDSCDCWGFGIAVIAGGALVSALGGRATFAIAGGMLLIVAVAAAFALRGRAPAPLRVAVA